MTIALSLLVVIAGCSSSGKAATTTTAAPTTTTASAITEPATTEPATTEPSTTEPATTEAATTVPATTEPPTTEDLSVPGDLPDGVYAVEITDADLEAVNVHDHDENHGTFTFTFTGGVFSFLQTATNPIQNPTGGGTYIVDGDQVTFLLPDGPGPQEFTWVENSDGSLTLTSLPSTNKYYAAYFASHPLMPVTP